MLIINADDWGGWREATDGALACFEGGRITSVSAMVFMDDSERAASLAEARGVEAGLHLNFTTNFTGGNLDHVLCKYHARIRRFLTNSKYSVLLYNPFLRREFRYVVRAQFAEFERLYGKAPAHIDGHHHMHLCSNVLVDKLIPLGSKVRKNFSFGSGEKAPINRYYRTIIDRRLARRYRTADFFFSLQQCLQAGSLQRVVELSKSANVELMTHPSVPEENAFLLGGGTFEMLREAKIGTYAML
jgi:chitin disaccharide deacetylase